MKKDLIPPSCFSCELPLRCSNLSECQYTSQFPSLTLGFLWLIPFSPKRNGRILPLEVVIRAHYVVALITGSVLMNVSGIPPIAIAHKFFCAVPCIVSDIAGKQDLV